MRPLRLTLRGFRSHTDTVVDFDGRSLVGIVGPTGSGKSSVLDGVAFALYGATPSTGNQTSKLINSRASEAQVELWVGINGETYRLTRVVKRGSRPSQQALERWTAVDGEKVETLSDKAREIGVHVERLLGLDYAAFTKSVMLAQGQFADLLRATPAEAAKVLTALFGFGVIERMRTAVKDRRTQVAAALAMVEKARVELSRKEVLLAEKRSEIATLEERRAALDTAVSAIADLEAEGASIDVRAAQLVESSSALAKARDGLPSVGEAETVAAQVLSHAATLSEADSALATAEFDAKAASDALDEAVAGGRQGAIQALKASITAESSARREMDEAARSHARAERAVAEGVEAVRVAEEAVGRLTQRLDEARTRALAADATLRELQVTHAAHTLAADLGPGDPCPVCARDLVEAPEIEMPTGLDAAGEAVTAARAALESAEKEAQAASSNVAGVTARLRSAEEVVVSEAARLGTARERHRTAVGDVETAVETLGGDRSRPVESLDTAIAAWETLLADRRTATARVEAATRAVVELRSADPGTLLEGLLTACVPAMELLEREPVAVAADEVVAHVASLVDGLESVEQRHRETTTRIDEERASLAERRTAVLERVHLRPDRDPRAEASELASTLAGASGAAALLEEQVLAERAAVAAEAETAKTAILLDRLHADLAPGKFPQFLLDERRAILAEHASESFRSLSGGRYEFVLESDQFRVRDLSSAGLVRDADTLSGGETFLASLALALGLASMVAMDDAVLDSFFVDEGFGSLDGDSLDLAMEGIERLVDSDDRLVVVVSHVAELRERIEDLIEFEKDPVTHESRLRSSAGEG